MELLGQPKKRGLAYEQACKALDRISCHNMLFVLEKPRFDLMPDHCRLLIEHKTIDSETMEPIIIKRSRMFQSLEYIRDEDEFIEIVWRCVMSAAVHEVGEFFKVNGKAIHHPHGKEL